MITLQFNISGCYNSKLKSWSRSIRDRIRLLFSNKNLREEGLQFFPQETQSVVFFFDSFKKLLIDENKSLIFRVLDEENLEVFKIALQQLKENVDFKGLLETEQKALLKRIKIYLPKSILQKTDINTIKQELTEIDVDSLKSFYTNYLYSSIIDTASSASLNITKSDQEDILDAIRELTSDQKYILKQKK